MAQFVQLQSNLKAFHEAGIGVVALTYDEPALQQAFVDKNKITYPFLSDVNAYTVKALGILKEENKPGDSDYGIPYPGIFIVTPESKIVGKLFVDGYQKRVSAEAVLAYAEELLN
jgi:peroxiredoxin